jgi:hypothetical protein
MKKLAILAIALLVGCDQGEDPTLVDLNGVECVIDEHLDSETGIFASYCRTVEEEAHAAPGAERIDELHRIWDNCRKSYPDRCDDVLDRGLRIWWVDAQDVLVPDHFVAVPWVDWPEYWEYPYEDTGDPGYGGMCMWGQGTMDHMHWLVVTTYQACPADYLLAHEMAHLMTMLPNGAEHDAVTDVLNGEW